MIKWTSLQKKTETYDYLKGKKSTFNPIHCSNFGQLCVDRGVSSQTNTAETVKDIFYISVVNKSH